MRRNTFRCLAAAIPVLLCGCSWSGEQKDVLEAFRRVSGILGNGEWETAIEEGLDAATGRFLDSLSADLSVRGISGYGSAAGLLQVMYREYVDFNGEVTMIFIDGGVAEITVTPAAAGSYSATPPGKYIMVLEGGDWKLNLSGVFMSGIGDALRGSYLH